MPLPESGPKVHASRLIKADFLAARRRFRLGLRNRQSLPAEAHSRRPVGRCCQACMNLCDSPRKRNRSRRTLSYNHNLWDKRQQNLLLGLSVPFIGSRCRARKIFSLFVCKMKALIRKWPESKVSRRVLSPQKSSRAGLS